MANIQYIFTPDVMPPGLFALGKAYNRQVMEFGVVAQTLPDISLVIAEPYPPIIEVRRYRVDLPATLVEILPRLFVRHTFVEASALPYSQRFVFRINTEDIQIKNFDNDDVFGDLGQDIAERGPSAHFRYEFILWDSSNILARPNPNKLLAARTDLTPTGLVNVFSVNARFQLSYDITLQDFVSYSTARRALTNKPKNRVVCLEDSEFLTMCMLFGFNAVRVNVYNSIGILVDRGIMDITAMGGAIQETTRVGVGPANINSMTIGNWFPDTVGVPWTTTPSISQGQFYDITFGVFNPSTFDLLNVPGLRPSETYRFHTKKCSCKVKYRIHFLNEFGCDDAITFEENEVIRYNTSDEFFERNLPAIFTPQDRSRIQLLKQADEIITLEKNNLTKAQVLWLKELLLSPNIFVEVGNRLFAYYIDSGDTTIIDTEGTNNSIEITLYASTQEMSQRN
jgi:hypothetical protein